MTLFCGIFFLESQGELLYIPFTETDLLLLTSLSHNTNKGGSS
jgi:hypothetical protein